MGDIFAKEAHSTARVGNFLLIFPFGQSYFYQIILFSSVQPPLKIFSFILYMPPFPLFPSPQDAPFCSPRDEAMENEPAEHEKAPALQTEAILGRCRIRSERGTSLTG
jgi:hypothetical protein